MALVLAVAPASFDDVKPLVLLPITASTAEPLVEARKLADALRYEEAVVEYQRYLAQPERPRAERASALLELAFISSVLGDEATAEQRAAEAFALEPTASFPSTASPKQLDFASRMKRRFESRPRLELVPREGGDAPAMVRVTVADAQHRVERVLLRYATAAEGPFASIEMPCTDGTCSARIPAPPGSSGFTAWYFVEALDASRATLGAVGSADAARQLVVVDSRPWYQHPVVWAVVGVVMVGAGAAVYALSPTPPTAR
ncbi:MAG: hypothetical protein JNG84_15285 [Archangium sp.]|nr:hypothetical protein [Archangium sp.]